MEVAVAVRVEDAMAGAIKASCTAAMHDQAILLAVALTVQDPMVRARTVVAPMARDPTAATAGRPARMARGPTAVVHMAEADTPMVLQCPMGLVLTEGTARMGSLSTIRMDSLMAPTLRGHRCSHL